jgi:hypothetical protein
MTFGYTPPGGWYRDAFGNWHQVTQVIYSTTTNHTGPTEFWCGRCRAIVQSPHKCNEG